MDRELVCSQCELLKQSFGQCQRCSFVPTSIGVARYCASQCVITRKRKYDHVSATIRDQLHLLPVRQRIDHTTLIYKCLHNTAPVYLRDMSIPVSLIWVASSISCSRRLMAPAHKNKNIWISCLWGTSTIKINILPATVGASLLTYEQFCSKLKSVMFNGAYMIWTAALTW